MLVNAGDILSGKEYYKNNREKWKTYKQLKEERGEEYLAKAREWGRASYHRRKNDPKNVIKYLLKHAKSRALKKNIEFSLDEKDIILPDICPYLKVPFDKGTRKYAYSLDRIDPSKGYTKENIQVISQLANAMKWDATNEELIQFATSVLEKHYVD